jgi:hypothetical protein
MKKIAFNLAAMVLALAAYIHLTQPGSASQTCYSGMCDASAVVSLDNEFFAVADDEQSIIRVYSRREAGRSVHALQIAPFLGLPRRAAEVDLEGAARLGDRVYWISSHGCNAAGEPQPSRRRFFATTGSISNGVIDLRPVGRPYAGLLQDLARDPRLAQFDLENAARRMPKAPDALNIEGLCATPAGHLLIGFRNPIPGGRALIVPLLNPAKVVDGVERARFGEPILLELGGLGIRSLGYHQDRYWIVGGPYAGGGPSQVFHWFGGADAPVPQTIPQFADLNPEALAFFTDSEGDRLWVASDDGTVKVGGVECKKLKDARLKRFRAASIPLSPIITAHK